MKYVMSSHIVVTLVRATPPSPANVSPRVSAVPGVMAVLTVLTALPGLDGV